MVLVVYVKGGGVGCEGVEEQSLHDQKVRNQDTGNTEREENF